MRDIATGTNALARETWICIADVDGTPMRTWHNTAMVTNAIFADVDRTCRIESRKSDAAATIARVMNCAGHWGTMGRAASLDRKSATAIPCAATETVPERIAGKDTVCSTVFPFTVGHHTTTAAVLVQKVT